MVIKSIVLTTTSLKEQINFYQHTLGLRVMEGREKSAVFLLGHTSLAFHESAFSTPYHFAINIPSNKARDALSWARSRVKILKDGDQELIDFKSWNAESVYFYDADRNIVEFIARKNLGIIADNTFGPEQFLAISEIGMPVNNIEETYNRLNQIKRIGIYDGNFESFCAIGDENGMFIVVDCQRKKWFPSQDQVFSSPFRIEGDFNFRFRDGIIFPELQN
ncbi:MAG: hypothetical protein KFF73_02325 [Cyclobacteriaceae bacterium]|nr:hypothetical protein [Cyclobacteriaceae bacterium]